MKRPSFWEQSTNTDYIYLADYDGYLLYKLIRRPGSTPLQTQVANRLVEEYLQKSFETPNKTYNSVIPFCGTTILAFFSQNATVTMKNINAMILGRLIQNDNSKYICYLSVLKEHREQGLGTKLLNEFIKDSIRERNSRITLHVNTENKSALSLYLRCGMRCIDYFAGYYAGDKTFATQNAFLMNLQIKSVKNSTAVCQSLAAVEISLEEEMYYKQRCPQAAIG